MIIVFLLWFINFPTLRYAGYLIVFLLIIFPYSIYLDKRINLSERNILKKLSVIFLISYTIFYLKMYQELIMNLLYQVMLIIILRVSFYWVKKNDFKEINLNEHKLYLTKDKCWATPLHVLEDYQILE